jgi:hypothetical protein
MNTWDDFESTVAVTGLEQPIKLRYLTVTGKAIHDSAPDGQMIDLDELKVYSWYDKDHEDEITDLLTESAMGEVRGAVLFDLSRRLDRRAMAEVSDE